MLHLGENLISGKLFIPSWMSDMTPRIAFLVATSISLMVARVHIMGAQLPVFTRFDNPASVAGTPVRQLTYNYLVSLNAWLLLFPSSLCCDWTMGTVPLIHSFFDKRNLGTLIFYASLLKLAHHALFRSSKMQSSAMIMVKRLFI